MGSEGPAASYTERRDRYAAARDALDRQAARVANASVALALAAIVGIGAAIWRGGPAVWTVAALLAAGFVAASVYQGRHARRRDEQQALTAVNAEGLSRLTRDGAHLPLRAPAGP